MKTLESRLQNGKVICKPGVSLTKQESYLQNGSLALQMGLSACNLPVGYRIARGLVYVNMFLLKFDKCLLFGGELYRSAGTSETPQLSSFAKVLRPFANVTALRRLAAQ